MTNPQSPRALADKDSGVVLSPVEPGSGARGGDLSYEFTDLAWDGYRGRWRYRVIERSVGTLYGRANFSVTFKRRSDAASFCSMCETRGAESAAKAMDASGLRPGVDFRVEAIRLADTSDRQTLARFSLSFTAHVAVISAVAAALWNIRS
jgi:hypothetical protein